MKRRMELQFHCKINELIEIGAGSCINCCKPNLDVIASILEPSHVAVSCLKQVEDSALKSPVMTIKYGFLFVVLSKLSSKSCAKFSKTPCNWIGERYKEIKLTPK